MFRTVTVHRVPTLAWEVPGDFGAETAEKGFGGGGLQLERGVEQLPFSPGELISADEISYNSGRTPGATWRLTTLEGVFFCTV